MRNKKKNRIFLLLILLLGITVGFAALATTLKINGNASINKNTWNIYWDNIGNEQGVTPSTTTAISADENNVPLSLVTWTVTFDKPGDFYEFQVDAVNAGTIDAEILSIEKKYNGNVISQENPLPSYLKYVISYADTGEPAVGDKLLKRDDSTTPFTPTRRRYKVRVEYDRTAVTNSDINNQTADVTCTFNLAVNYGQSTTPAVPAPVDFADDSWETIKSVATLPDPTTGPYHVGDTRTIDMDLDGTGPKTYTLRIANLSRPSECSQENFSQTACGFVLEFVDIITTHRMNTKPNTTGPTPNGAGTKGSWEYSDMRAYLNNGQFVGGVEEPIDYTTTGLYSKIPQELRNKIVDTKVITGCESIDWDDQNNVPIYEHNGENYETIDKVYLFSTHEVWEDGTTPQISVEDTAYNNTRQLDYYSSLNVTFDNYVSNNTIKKYNLGDNSWWLRTPTTNYDEFYLVPHEWIPSDYASMAYGVSPAFRLG